MSVSWIAGRSAFAVTFGVAGLVAGGLGVAVASSGGVFVLGEHNAATSVTTLSNSKGSALSLNAKHGKPPLTVNSNKEVKHLNAALVGGSTASQLKTAGSGAATHFKVNYNATVKTTPTPVATTGKLKKGTYYVTATAMLEVPGGDPGGFCALSTANLTNTLLPPAAESGTAQQGIGTLSDTRPMTVAGGQRS